MASLTVAKCLLRMGLKNPRILSKNGLLDSHLVLLESEKSSLLRWLCSKGTLMQLASSCTVYFLYYLPSIFYLRTNIKFVCLHWIRHTARKIEGYMREGRLAFKWRWVKNLSDWKRKKRNSIWDTIWESSRIPCY